MSTLKDLISLGQLIKTEFFPVRFQTILKGLSHPVILDVEDPNIPWELIHDGQQFTFLKVALGKRLITAEEHKENIPSKNKRLRILIVGVSETKVEGFTSLPTVEHEVELLQELFAQMPQVEDLTEDDVLFGKNAKESAFIERLVSGVYDVIHFSGHAYFNEESPELSALILNDHAFTVNDIKRKVEGKPLVFLNACVSGVYQRVESDIGYIGSFTVGLASAFIIGGALASIGTLMNVTDSYASEFALAFYKNALSGEALGDSLKRSRQKLKDLYPDNLVWASYMLFGDPTIRLKSQE